MDRDKVMICIPQTKYEELMAASITLDVVYELLGTSTLISGEMLKELIDGVMKNEHKGKA